MTFTVEISHYPLTDEYEASVIQFIKCLKTYKDLLVVTNAMSTHVKGDSKEVFDAIRNAIELTNGKAHATVLKIINRDLPVEAGRLEF